MVEFFAWELRLADLLACGAVEARLRAAARTVWAHQRPQRPFQDAVILSRRLRL